MTASTEIQEIAVITGASTGIGAAAARELAQRGFHVLAGVRRDQDADAIRGPGIEPTLESGDLGCDSHRGPGRLTIPGPRPVRRRPAAPPS